MTGSTVRMGLSRADIEAMALDVLKRCGLVPSPSSVESLPIDPVQVARALGVKVHQAVFDDESISGMVSQRRSESVILVNYNDHPTRKRFTIAHELAHKVLHLSGEVGEEVDTQVSLLRSPVVDERAESPARRKEVQANQFAASLLMPEPMVRLAWQQQESSPFLARLFQVSEDSMAVRLRTLGLVEA